MAGASNYNTNNESKIKTTQAEVEEVVGIMRNNLEKVLERDTKLSELHDRADALNHGAFQFEKQAQSLKKKMWWQNMRMKIIIGGGIAVFLLIIIIWIMSSSSSSTEGQ